MKSSLQNKITIKNTIKNTLASPAIIKAIEAYDFCLLYTSHLRENVIGLHALVAVFGSQFQKILNIQMPHIQRHGYGALAFALLVDGHCGIIQNTNPRDNTAGGILYPLDAGAFGTDAGNVHPYPAAEFGNRRHLILSLIHIWQNIFL